ncbi:MAG: Uma2 family endonuclease, partial [Pseudomonadota bacterium]
ETRPDWVCEILSPSTARIDRTDKLEVYAAFGVPHAWYVDPIAKTLEVFALTDARYTIAATFKTGDDVTAVPFDTHTFSIDILWPLDTPEDTRPS